MPQINDSHEMINFTLFFNISKNDESRRSKIKDKLCGEKRLLSVASINSEDRIYEISATPAEMAVQFEALKAFIKVGEYMTCHSADKQFNTCYSPQNKVVTVDLL